MGRDLWIALRRLAHAPGFTLFAIATLAFGIGTTTVAYSVIASGLWRDPGIAQPDRVVYITRTNGTRLAPAFVAEDDVAVIAHAATLSESAAYAAFGASFVGPVGPELQSCQLVSGGFFPLLGVAPKIGRGLGPADDAVGAPAAAVISETMWRRQYAADPGVLGRTFTLGTTVFAIVGVMPEAFTGPEPMPYRQIAAWVPLSFSTAIDRGRPADSRTRRTSAWLRVVGRLAPGATAARASAEITLLGEQQDRARPLPPIVSTVPGQEDATPRRAWAAPLLRTQFQRATDTEAGVMIIMLPALVLLVACSNLANLVLSRGLARRQDFAIRRALGATRWRLVSDGLVEVVVVSAGGVAAGLFVAQALLAGALSAVHDAIAAYAPALEISIRLQPTAFVAAALAGVISVVIAGVIPMLQLSRRPSGALSMDTPDRALPRWRGRGGLIAAQVAISFGLFLITVIAVRAVTTGVRAPHAGPAGDRIDLDAVAAAVVPFQFQGTSDQRAAEVTEAALRDLQRSPAVAAAGAGSGWAFMGATVFARRAWTMVTTPERPFVPGRAVGVDARLATATPGLFAALGITPANGRLFTDQDGPASPAVAVLNRGAIDQLGAGAGVGREVQFLLDNARYARTAGRPTTVTVVGIVDDGERDGRNHAQATIYLPAAQQFDPGLMMVARARDGDATSVVQTLRHAVRGADPALAVTYVGPAGLLTGGGVVAARVLVMMAATLSAFAMLLAMSGLYAVLSYVVAHRTREMGVRIALGADARRILFMILRGGLAPVVRGVILGLGAAALVRKLMQVYFTYELSAIDPLAFTLAALPLLAAGVVACWFPARRASRVDPNVALRHL